MSGIGGIFKAMGGGVAQMNMQNQQMELLRGQMGLQSGKFVAPEPVSGTLFYKPNFNAANGYDLRNLGGNPMPIGFNPDNSLKYN